MAVLCHFCSLEHFTGFCFNMELIIWFINEKYVEDWFVEMVYMSFTSWLFRAATNLSSAIMLKRAKICRRAACGLGGRGALPGLSRLDVLLVTVRGKSSHCEPTWRHRLHRCHAAFHFNFPLAMHCAIHCALCILLHWGHISALVLGLQNSFKSSKRHFNWSRLLVHWGVQGKHLMSAGTL